MPRTIIGDALRFTGTHQAALAILSIAVSLLSAAPLELQRRIINTIVDRGGRLTTAVRNRASSQSAASAARSSRLPSPQAAGGIG